MEVKIGVKQAPKELLVDTNDSVEDIERELGQALESDGILRLVDIRGRTVLVPASTIAYVELGSPTAGTVGFR